MNSDLEFWNKLEEWTWNLLKKNVKTLRVLEDQEEKNFERKLLSETSDRAKVIAKSDQNGRFCAAKEIS